MLNQRHQDALIRLKQRVAANKPHDGKGNAFASIGKYDPEIGAGYFINPESGELHLKQWSAYPPTVWDEPAGSAANAFWRDIQEDL